jgi:hypothetical protein
MNNQTELGQELLILLRRLLNNEEWKVCSLGDGILCMHKERDPSDKKIECVLVFDPEKWTLGDRVMKTHECSCTFKCDFITGRDTPSDPNLASGMARLLLRPRNEDVKFYDDSRYVVLDSVAGKSYTN